MCLYNADALFDCAESSHHDQSPFSPVYAALIGVGLFVVILIIIVVIIICVRVSVNIQFIAHSSVSLKQTI